jgi:hypothetical protein
MKDKEEDRLSIWQSITVVAGTPIDRRNNRRFTGWCLAWAAALIGATWIVDSYDSVVGPIAWLVALSPNIFAIGALVAYLRFLRMADEMQRRIQIEGLAIGFGTGWIFTIGYLVLQTAGAPAIPLSAIILVMTAGWIVGNIIAVRHYR